MNPIVPVMCYPVRNKKSACVADGLCFLLFFKQPLYAGGNFFGVLLIFLTFSAKIGMNHNLAEKRFGYGLYTEEHGKGISQLE
jgi:hypothetical protein